MEMAGEGETDRAKLNLGEVNMSLGTYTPHEVIEQAFGLSSLPRGFKVAPNQPLPCDRKIYGLWMLVLGTLFVVYLMAGLIKDKPDGWLVVWAMFLASVIPIGAWMVNNTFNVKRWSDSDFSPYTTE